MALAMLLAPALIALMLALDTYERRLLGGPRGHWLRPAPDPTPPPATRHTPSRQPRHPQLGLSG